MLRKNTPFPLCCHCVSNGFLIELLLWLLLGLDTAQKYFFSFMFYYAQLVQIPTAVLEALHGNCRYPSLKLNRQVTSSLIEREERTNGGTVNSLMSLYRLTAPSHILMRKIFDLWSSS